MANTIPARAPQTLALETYLATQTSAPVGDGEKPPTASGWQGAPGQSEFVAYTVVHSIPGGALDGPLGDPHADSALIWQIDTYGATQLASETLGDLVLGALLVAGRPPLVIAGRRVLSIALETPGGGARQDPDEPSIWRQMSLWNIATTPT
jgi:hypothetical protein